jgi:hypothetical protein
MVLADLTNPKLRTCATASITKPIIKPPTTIIKTLIVNRFSQEKILMVTFRQCVIPLLILSLNRH